VDVRLVTKVFDFRSDAGVVTVVCPEAHDAYVVA
jgi:hypothetical protein